MLPHVSAADKIQWNKDPVLSWLTSICGRQTCSSPYREGDGRRTPPSIFLCWVPPLFGVFVLSCWNKLISLHLRCGKISYAPFPVIALRNVHCNPNYSYVSMGCCVLCDMGDTFPCYHAPLPPTLSHPSTVTKLKRRARKKNIKKEINWRSHFLEVNIHLLRFQFRWECLWKMWPQHPPLHKSAQPPTPDVHIPFLPECQSRVLLSASPEFLSQVQQVDDSKFQFTCHHAEYRGPSFPSKPLKYSTSSLSKRQFTKPR